MGNVTDLEIHWDKLDDLFGSMNEVGLQSNDVTAYFASRVCDSSGFAFDTSVLRPIADVLPELSGYFEEMQAIFLRRWADLADAIAVSARNLDRVDESVRIDFDGLRGQGPSGTQMGPHITASVRLFEPESVADALTDPQPGEPFLNHNNKFDWVADAWDQSIATINQGAEILRRMGMDVPNLPDQSLRERIIYPLSANYEQIRTNANACPVLAQGMQTWGMNFTTLSANVAAVMLGRTSESLVVHLNLYHLAVAGMGVGVGAGTAVFDQIALMSEKIAVEVEDALVLLGERIARLSRKVATRLIPYAGWTVGLFEFLAEGKEMFADIAADIEVMIRMVDDLMALADEVRAWAETAAERLKTFRQILDAAKDLPAVGAHQGIEDLVRDVSNVEQALNDINAFGTDGGPEHDSVDDRLGQLDEASNAFSEIDADEDAIPWAPGPIGGLYDPETGQYYTPEQPQYPTA